MALPRDPRQKMVNIMYLVLTAMLALNVSAEILNAFTIVNNSIDHSNLSITGKNNSVYSAFDKQLAADPGRVGPLKAKADAVKSEAQAAYDSLEALKQLIVKESGGWEEVNGEKEVKEKANLDVPTRIMENQKRGPALEALLKKFRTNLLNNVDPKEKEAFNKALPLQIEDRYKGEDGKDKSWTTYHFNMVPVVAAVTIIGKLQNDVKNSEAMVAEDLLKQIHANDIPFDKMQSFVSMDSRNLQEGQTLTAHIAIGAYSSTVNPDIVVNGQTLKVENGIATYTMPVSGLGEKKLTGTISLKKPNGEVINADIDEAYTVGASATSISADKMNVLYIGVQNPISITAAGVPAEKVEASVTGGSIAKKAAGQFLVTVSAPGKANINVSADGKTLSSKEFRVKFIPDPVLKVGFNKSGYMKASEFKVQGGLRADLENFEFEGVKYDVVGYRIGIDAKGKDYAEGDANSAYFPSTVKATIASLKPGDQVYFDNVKVKGPDGRVRDMGNISFKLN
ncbi:gliding motility-associated protein GldM [Chitinophaga costaii]|uniref:Gliding motility-associated protein GldM n=1 Tax=Chitinophaga costaii TaxID=1335309 RepID=A0A1C4B3T0_9BACT|nr:gliding motility protein GldM [Chitinophaga costaii]PUZ26856.1 gliding motility protein GldM [Chitinophaga costaii]SCC01517.1 gliding motility-associated protein GldM [Chitinophaga costaii]